MTRMRTLFAALVGMPLIFLALTTGSASATAPTAKITNSNQAQLLPDGSAVLTVTYTCAPGPANDTTGFINSILTQGPINGSDDEPATCDNRSQTVHLVEAPGPFSQGAANAIAVILNTDGSSIASSSRAVMIK